MSKSCRLYAQVFSYCALIPLGRGQFVSTKHKFIRAFQIHILSWILALVSIPVWIAYVHSNYDAKTLENGLELVGLILLDILGYFGVTLSGERMWIYTAKARSRGVHVMDMDVTFDQDQIHVLALRVQAEKDFTNLDDPQEPLVRTHSEDPNQAIDISLNITV